MFCEFAILPFFAIIVTLSVPLDPDNTDYQNILKWVEEGNTIEEAD